MFKPYPNSKKKRLCAFSPKSRKIGISVSPLALDLLSYEEWKRLKPDESKQKS